MISIYKPDRRDLWFRQAMLADEETMSYNRAWGGTIPFPEEKWDDWYARWVLHPEGGRFYRYVKNEAGAFVGEIAYHYDEALNGYIANVIIHAKFRGRGFGRQALDALCALARENGVRSLFDDIAIDNPAIRTFLRHGFTERRRTDEKIVLEKEL